MTLSARLFLLLSAFLPASLFSQTYIRPNYGMKSHETLEVIRIEAAPQGTTIYLSLENKITGGYFCTDKRTYIIYPDGSRSRMIKASGIPYCPELHKFYAVGEKLHFELTFPPLKEGTKWIDLVEQCGGNCYWVYGITLDNELNRRIDEIFNAASNGKPADNMLLFRKFLEENDNLNPGIEGLLYVNIINAAIEAGDRVAAEVWYKRLAASDAPRAG
jgi:hypothetical protein